MPTFGGLLREFRIRYRLSQEELAEKAGISEAAVGALERGIRKAPYLDTAEKLAKALDLTPDEAHALLATRRNAHGRSQPRVAHNLLAERTSLVGREGDVESLLRLLKRSRLVTITGSGGVGKTRVALKAARCALGDPWAEVWFVDLAALGEGEFIASKIAASILPALRDRQTIEEVLSALAGRQMLLILDNCEHIIEYAARAADRILERCPEITVLATSRERLNVAGEFVYRLPSLERQSAIELFVARAEAVAPHWTFNENTLLVVDEIARRLGGIPLAIELTAAQLPALGLEMLRGRLDDEFRLPSGRRDLPARQQTVLATIEWSYNLLSRQEREALSEISIFAGSFDLAGAEGVRTRDGGDPSLLLATLSALVDKSLLNVETVDGRVRYVLLESVRGFGLDRLRGAGRYDDLARRAATWLAACCETSDLNDMRNEDIARYLLEMDNIRSALAWSLDSPSPDNRALGGRIISGFADLWTAACLNAEHRRWVENALERIDESRFPLVVARLLRCLLHRSQYSGTVLEVAARATRAAERSGDWSELTTLHCLLTGIYASCRCFDDAERSAAIVADLHREASAQDSKLYAAFLSNRSFLRMQQGRLEEARADAIAAGAMARALGDEFGITENCFRLINIEYASGNCASALDYAERVRNSNLGIREDIQFRALKSIAGLRLLSGDLEGAQECVRQLLLFRRNEIDNVELEYAALSLVLNGSAVTAARILGFVRAWEERTRPHRLLARKDAHDLLCSSLREHLSEAELEAAAHVGAFLTYAQAVDEALAALDS